MFQMQMADLRVQVNNRYTLIQEKCRDYLLPNYAAPDIVMEPSVARMQYSIEFKKHFDGASITMAEAEYDAAPYLIYGSLPRFQAVWLHAAVVEMDGRAYAFTAPSGCGKSTHIGLWLQAFGDRVRVINGDNPILRLRDGEVIAYGTPFCGKEGWQINIGVPLAAIVFLRRSSENSIMKMDTGLAFSRLLRYNHCITPDTLEAHMQIYETILSCVPVYQLSCNTQPEAAWVAWRGMTDGGIEE